MKKAYIISGFFMVIALGIFGIQKTTSFNIFRNDSVSKNISITQLSATVSESIKWVKTIKVSEIQNNGHLVEIPVDAILTKISILDTANISSSSIVLSNADRKKLSALASERENSTSTLQGFYALKKTGIKQVSAQNKKLFFVASVFNAFSDISSKLFADVLDAVTPDVSSTSDMTIVDITPLIDATTSDQIFQEIISTSSDASSSPEIISTSSDLSESSSIFSEFAASSTASSTDVVQVEYETSAPIISEADTETGKVVTVSATDTPDTTITNVLAYTNIPEIFEVGEEDSIQIKWSNNDDQQVSFHAYDLDHNGYLDYVEWTVPHLSTQTFEIIFISKAFKLNAQKHIVADIYNKVSEQDNVWSSINDSQYVRVTFTSKLTNLDDIVLYARPKSPNISSRVEIYPVYEDENGNLNSDDSPIATIDTITHTATYKTLIPNLGTPTDIFDLKIVGNIEIDYIVDPTCVAAADNSLYTVCTYTSSNTFVTPSGVATATVLVVAGGGGGGGSGGGGAGAGGYLASTSYAVSGSITVTIGAGGGGSNSSGAKGTNGSNSVFGSLTATGGGGGGSGDAGFKAGANGGSGGGVSRDGCNAGGGTGTSGQGNNGGNTVACTWAAAAGGGGAGAVGGAGSATNGSGPDQSPGGNGGAGTANSISGSSVTYAGGGGGSSESNTPGSGGIGGGGAGGFSQAPGSDGTNGTANTGGGGGGAGRTKTGGTGGSGIVIVRYLTPVTNCTTATDDPTYTVCTYNTTSSFVTPAGVTTASVLVVAGGGGGGNNIAGGGGAGGYLASTSYPVSGTITVIVGAGGAGGSSAGAKGTSGNDSIFGSLDAVGGGGGSGGATGNFNGISGGSGGGASGGPSGATGGSGTAGQGNNGGNYITTNAGGAGGGGAGTVGSSSSLSGGDGGAGIANSISGVSTYYAGGGGGAGWTGYDLTVRGAGGLGGGGNGGSTNQTGFNATANTGGGGGGGCNGNLNGGSGGSGIVIVRYLTPSATTFTWDGGGADNNWGTAVNWVGDVAPVPGSSLTFTGSTRTSPVNDFATGTSFGTITISASGFTLSGNSLGTSTVVASHSSGNVTLSLIIGGGSTVSNTAAGTLILSGVNTYTGGSTIQAGTIQVQTSASALGTGTTTIGHTSGSNSATLIGAGANLTYANPISVATGSSGTLSITNSQNTTFSGAITLNNNLTLTLTTGNLTFTGGVTGTGNLILNNNTTLGNSITLSTANVNMIGTITNSGTGFGASAASNISSIIGTNVTGIIQNSANTVLTLSNVNTFTTGITIKSGTLLGTASNAFGATTSVITLGDDHGSAAATLALGNCTPNIPYPNAVTVASGSTGTLTIRNNSCQVNDYLGGAITLNNNLTLSNSTGPSNLRIQGGIVGTGNLSLQYNASNNGSVILETSAINFTGTITNNGSAAEFANQGNDGIYINTVIGTNVTGVIQNSPTIMRLAGVNTFTTGITIKKGTVQAQTSNSALGTGTTTIGDTSGTQNASLIIGTNGLSLSNPIVLGSATGTLTIGNNLTGVSGTFSGGVTGTNNLTVNENGTSGTVTFSTASVNNAGTITNIGAGTGTTTISAAIGSNVTGIIASSTASALTISGAIIVNTSTTTLTNSLGTKLLTISGGTTGAGNLVINNNSSTANGVTISTNSLNNTGTITNSGSGSGTETITGSLIGANVTGLVQNSSTSGLTLSGATTLVGFLNIIAGTFTAPAANMNISGNFTNAGTFTHNSGTTTLNGGNQTITGNTTFYNLIKSTSSSPTLTFAAGSTTTIPSGGSLTLAGTSGNLLLLRSSISGTRWNLVVNAAATQTVSYVNFKDSNAAGGATVAATNSTNSGNTLNWTPYYTATWDGGGSDDNWSTAANWVGDVAPIGNANEAIVFDSTGVGARPTPDLDFSYFVKSFASITVSASGYNLISCCVALISSIVVDTYTSGTSTIHIRPNNPTITMNASGVLVLISEDGYGGSSGGIHINSGTVVGTNVSDNDDSPTPFGGDNNPITIGTTTGSSNATLVVVMDPSYLNYGYPVLNPITIASGNTGVATIRLDQGYMASNITLNNHNLSIVGNGGSLDNDNQCGSCTGITGTGNITIQNNSSGGMGILNETPINNIGTITNSGTGSGSVGLYDNIGTNVTGIIQNSSTSALILDPVYGDPNTFTGGITIKKGIVEGQDSNNAFGANSSTITLGDTSGNANASLLAIGSGFTFANPIVLGAATGTLTVGNSGTAITTTFSGGVTGANNLTINEGGTTGRITFSTAAINNAGTITNLGSGTGSTTISGGVGANVTAINLNSTSTALNISTNALTVASGGTTITNASGTAAITVSGGVTGSGNLVINNNSTTASGISLTTASTNNTGTITNSGTGSGSVLISGGIGSNVTGLTQNSSTSNLSLTGTDTITGNLAITSGTLLAPTTLNVSGNWTNSGIFTHNSGTVTLNGGNQTITGNTTFYNLIKSTSSSPTLTFAGGSTTTISSSGTLTLAGTSGHLLFLRSGSTPTRWNLVAAAGQAISYVDVMDSDASGGTAITQSSSTDSGHNLNWLFDSVPPTITLATVSPYFATSTVTAVGTSTDTGNVTSVQYQMDGTGGSWSSCTATDASFNGTSEPFTCTATSLSEGSHTIYVRSTDGYSNTTSNANAASSTFTVDTIAPSVNAGTDKTASTTISQNATASDGGSGVASYLWSKASGSGSLIFSATTSATTNISADTDGSYVVKITTTDNAGNSASSTFNLTWDATAPTVSDNVPSSWQSVDFAVTLTCIDATTACSKVFYVTDGTTPTTASSFVDSGSSYQFTQSTEGNFVLTYRGMDTAGNLESTQTATNHLRLDKTVPSVSVTAPSDNATTSGSSVIVSANATDTLSLISGVMFKLDTTQDIGSLDTSSPYSVTFDTTGISEGAHTIIAVATDNAGNISTSSVIHITVDNVAPIRSNGQPSGTLAINTSTTTISLDTNENATCKYSTASTTPYGSMTVFSTTGGTSHSKLITGLTNGGSYDYYVLCQDTQGNTNNTLFTISFTVQADITAPIVDITAPLDNAVVSGNSLSITASSTDDVSVSGVQFIRDGNITIGAEDTVAPYTTTLDTTSLLDGYHTIIAVAHDGTGNYSTSSIITVRVDNSAPIVDAGTDKIKNALFTQDASTTDVTSGIASYLWSKVSGPGTITFGSISSEDTTVSANTDGSYVLKLTATDNAGNSASSTFNLTWDTTNPAVNAGTDKIASTTFNQNATVTDLGSGIASYLWSKVSGPGVLTFSATTSEDTNISANTDGNYVIKLLGTDNANNSASSTFNLTWDTTAPTVSDNVPSGWQTTNFVVTLTCNDTTTSCSKVYYTTDNTIPTIASSFVDSGSSYQFTQSTEGSSTLKYRGIDTLGNLESTQTGTNLLKLDKTAPVVTDNLPSGYQNSDITVTLSCTDSISGCSKVYYTTDGSTPTTGSVYVDVTSSYAFTWTTEGDFVLKYRGEDVATNLESVQTATNHIQLDKTGPIISNISPADGSTVSRSDQVITFSLSEFGDCRIATALKSYDQMSGDTICTTNMGLQISCTAPELNTGINDIYVTCEDTIGNKDSTSTATHLSYNVSGVSRPPVNGGGGGGTVTPPSTANMYVIVINGGTPVTDNRNVLLSFGETAGSDATAIVLSTDPNFSNATIIPFQSSSVFNLCDGNTSCPDGTYTVYAKFLNPYGIAYPTVSATIYLNAVPLITEIASTTSHVITTIASTTKEIITAILPPQEPAPIVYPPVEVSVPEIPQYVFLGTWQLSLAKLLDDFVFASLPADFRNTLEKFPDITDILAKVGITRLSDLGQLTTTQISLPSLAETVGLDGQNLALSEFSKTELKQIPTDIVFVRTSDQSIDLKVKLSISNDGLALKTVNTIQGKPLSFVVKPDAPAKSVEGYLIFKSSATNQVSERKSLPKNSLGLFGVATAFAAETELSGQNVTAQTGGPDLVLSKFAYTEDVNGVWTADVLSPQVLGQYELRTVVNFKEAKKAPEQISMIVVVDPEGYVFEKLPDGREVRLNNAVVSLYWQNPETNIYEIWPAKDFRQENPQTTDVTGRYSFLVPTGMYYLSAHLGGYSDYKGEPFQVEESKGVFINIELKQKFNLGAIINFQNILLLGIFIILAYLAIMMSRRRGRASGTGNIFIN